MTSESETTCHTPCASASLDEQERLSYMPAQATTQSSLALTFVAACGSYDKMVRCVPALLILLSCSPKRG
jgi:hypothetical protein